MLQSTDQNTAFCHISAKHDDDEMKKSSKAEIPNQIITDLSFERHLPQYIDFAFRDVPLQLIFPHVSLLLDL